jgi:hypothetical protein
MFIKYSEAAYTSNQDYRKIVRCKGEDLTGKNTIKVTREMVDKPFESKHDVYFDLSKNKIFHKTEEMKAEDAQ